MARGRPGTSRGTVEQKQALRSRGVDLPVPRVWAGAAANGLLILGGFHVRDQTTCPEASKQKAPRADHALPSHGSLNHRLAWSKGAEPGSSTRQGSWAVVLRVPARAMPPRTCPHAGAHSSRWELPTKRPVFSGTTMQGQPLPAQLLPAVKHTSRFGWWGEGLGEGLQGLGCGGGRSDGERGSGI